MSVNPNMKTAKNETAAKARKNASDAKLRTLLPNEYMDTTTPGKSVSKREAGAAKKAENPKKEKKLIKKKDFEKVKDVVIENVVAVTKEEKPVSDAKVVVVVEPDIIKVEEAVVTSEAKIAEQPVVVEIKNNFGLSLVTQVTAVVEAKGCKLICLDENNTSVVAHAKPDASERILKVEATLGDSSTFIKLCTVGSAPSSTVNSTQSSTAGNSPLVSRTSTPLSSAPDVPKIILNDKPLHIQEPQVAMMNSFALSEITILGETFHGEEAENLIQLTRDLGMTDDIIDEHLCEKARQQARRRPRSASVTIVDREDLESTVDDIKAAITDAVKQYCDGDFKPLVDVPLPTTTEPAATVEDLNGAEDVAANKDKRDSAFFVSLLMGAQLQRPTFVPALMPFGHPADLARCDPAILHIHGSFSPVLPPCHPYQDAAVIYAGPKLPLSARPVVSDPAVISAVVRLPGVVSAANREPTPDSDEDRVVFQGRSSTTSGQAAALANTTASTSTSAAAASSNQAATNQACANPAPPPRNRDGLKCTYCGREGHDEWECWTKYPALKKRQGGSTANKTPQGIKLALATPAKGSAPPPKGGQGGQQQNTSKHQLAQDAFRKAAEAGKAGGRRRGEGRSEGVDDKVKRRGRGQMKFFDEFAGGEKVQIPRYAYVGGRFE
ncbi:hypothetical protein K491DRAFT_783095 [Lophiostoma macrostomum CBS 122681]|uniref:CCHC-type domain-containing protein n=1 Tax=Lophiostoma macrostomum CBS 122681 TaxID=1314788 RepID=A0A6A6SPZ6_9PLEO|nr:hypothetical protein K491DRAFT_783095 [Lophiostoma macrostomum CBS 122681]